MEKLKMTKKCLCGFDECSYIKEIEELTNKKESVYKERNMLVYFLSQMYSSILYHDPTNNGSWPNNIRWIIYIFTPEGQLSWHVSDEEYEKYFKYLPVTDVNPWDGHTTEQKYNRLNRLHIKQVL